MGGTRHTVVLVGAEGRMGRFARQMLGTSDEFELTEAIDRVEGRATTERIARVTADLGLDFTVAGLGAAHGRAMLDAGIRPVIGTSGVEPDDVAELDRHARALSLGGLVVPNFSLGMAVLMRAANDAARIFPDCEIVELHHARKVDAPSGTAAETARRIAATRGSERGDVPIHSVRLPGLYAHQEVLFGGVGETLRLRHDMLGPEAFGPGILGALRYALGAAGVAVGLECALDGPLGDPAPPS